MSFSFSFFHLRHSSFVDPPLKLTTLSVWIDILIIVAIINLLGVSGGTASGKTTVCDMIIQQLHDHRVVLVNQVSFLSAGSYLDFLPFPELHGFAVGLVLPRVDS